ncbi:MAG: molybdopterin molybdotransferase MoeA [Clostridia bacterium]|nr:molybdopterin molybdotransferase MoeA [Clostridia bacterium]MBQ3897726.1 molybdopterin molybdotransferase MoeA [Clostridia bacterium]
MLTVKTSAEAEKIISETFGMLRTETEEIPLSESTGRILAEDIISKEDVPGFNRSTVDGYAVKAADTFGCSDSIPAILDFKGEVLMGVTPDFEIEKDQCAYVPTGGELPKGADAMVMLEFSEDYGDGTRALLKPSAPGQHVTFIGDDVKCGAEVLKAGTCLAARHIGALAAMGYSSVRVYKRLKVAVLSTGDELVDVTEEPKGAQVRDINSYELCAALKALGCEYTSFGIVKDELPLLESKVKEAVENYDMVIVSGGSSVGVKDATFKVYDKLGEVLFHGIAIKPGKPTICANIDGKPCFGLPGHPLAAFYIFNLFVKPLVLTMGGAGREMVLKKRLPVTLSIPSNHGREECMGVKIVEKDGREYAEPVYTKSGLISTLSQVDGFIRISRDCEGIGGGEEVEVELF